MNILMSNLRMDHFGGSEIWLYHMVEELLNQGHTVDLFTTEKGDIYDRLIALGAQPFLTNQHYDLAVLNHFDCVESIRQQVSAGNLRVGYTIQTCHGTVPPPEKPHSWVDKHFAVSDEVHRHLKSQGVQSEIAYNPVNLNRFDRHKPVSSSIERVLCLCVGLRAQEELTQIGHKLGIDVTVRSKWKAPVFDLENAINEHDLVVGYGRGIIESIACGRNVIVYDSRRYTPKQGDGLLTQDNFERSMMCNFSGRATQRKLIIPSLRKEIEKANSQGADWIYAKRDRFNVVNIVKQYLTASSR